jgi:cell fate regulator YaaT (PSP1 superfamily)
MGCNGCSSGGGGTAPKGCENKGSCMTNGCNKLDVYDWLSQMDLPANYKPFNIIEVRFKGSRKEFFINQDNLYLEMGELVAVESSTGGYDLGHVSLTGELVRLQLKKNKVNQDLVVKKVYRKATHADFDKWQLAKDLEWETMHQARTFALELGLSMKISDVDFQGDKTKATFYYTAEGRVDFRELIKKMAETFRIRIEMRQIGMRQEASRLGGIGSCGRELCCSTWLTEFKTVSTSAARYQNLSLNTLKLAGQCGKLKCCLNYELDSYMDALKDIPNNVEKLETVKGPAYLQKTDIFKRLMWFAYPRDENWVPLHIEQVKEIQILNKEGKKPEDLKTIMADILPKEKSVEYDYENVVGQDSLTRLDETKRKKRSPNRNKQKSKRATPSSTKQEEKTVVKEKVAKPTTETKVKASETAPEGEKKVQKRNKRRFNSKNRKSSEQNKKENE